MSESVTQEPYTTWHIIKPEAAIFTDIILEYGIDGIIAQNILDVDDYDKLSEDTTFGLIFAYKTKSLQHQDNSVENPDAANIVFTYQIIDNSCATLSLVNILFNIEEYRSEFTQGFLDHTNGMDANDRGQTLMNSPAFKRIHNAYDVMEHQARSSIKVSVDISKPSTNSETSYHYISYLYKDNAIWELDNQKDYPIKLQSISSNGENKESWLHVLKGIIRSKIEEDSLESNLFAITIDPINVKEYELKRTYADIRGLETKLMGTAKSLFTRKSSRHKTNLSKESQKALRLKRKLEKNAEQIKEELNQLKREGLIEAVSISRRKFDYAPFISHMLEILDKKELDVEEDIHLNSTYSEVTTNTATEEDPSTLFQNNKKTAYLSLKEKTPAETSSEKRKGKNIIDPTFIKRAIPKRKATEGVVYTTTNVSIACSAPSKKEDQTLKLKSNNTLILRIPSKGLLPKKRDRKEDQDEASSGRDKKRYSLRK